jgi:hypothetical protein
MPNWLKRLILRAGYGVALALLGVQSFIILADFFITTFFFDELGGFLVTAALTWIVKKQRDMSADLAATQKEA